MLSEAGLSFRDIASAPKTVPTAANRQPQERPSEHLGLKVVILEKALNAARQEVLKWNEAARAATAERETATASLAARIAELERELCEAAAAAAQPKVEPSASEKRRTMLAMLRDPGDRHPVQPRDRAALRAWRRRPCATGATAWSAAFGNESAPQRVVTRAGRTYRMNTRRIGKRAKAR